MEANDLIVVEQPKEIEVVRAADATAALGGSTGATAEVKVDGWVETIGLLASDVPRGKPCQTISPSGKPCRKVKSPHFCEAESEIIEEFWRGLRLVEDPYVGEVFELLSWFRRFLFDTLCIKRWNDGKGFWERHYRVGYIIIPKGNMKTTSLSGLALYFLATLPPGSYSCLTAQGKGRAMMNIYRVIQTMMDMSPIMENIQVDWKRDGQWIRRTPGLPDVILEVVAPERFDAKRGPRTRFAIVDEYAFIASMAEFFNVVRKAWFSQSEPYMAMATTPSKDPMSWERQMTPRMFEHMEDPSVMPRWYPVLFCATENDNMDLPENWLKWNPGIQAGIGDIQILHDEHQESEGDPAARNDFYTDRCASPRDTKAAFLKKDEWDACLFEGGLGALRARAKLLPAYVGFDLSETSDLSAMCVLTIDEDAREMFADVYSWVPERVVPWLDKKLSGKLSKWLADPDVPLFVLEAGKTFAVDVAYHSLRILELYDDIRYIGYDYRSATEASAVWRNHYGAEIGVRSIMQGFGLNEAIKQTRDLVSDRSLFHGGNPVLDYAIDTADLKADIDGNFRLVKYELSQTPVRIDAAVAMVTAMQARKSYLYYSSQHHQVEMPEPSVLSY